MHANDDSAGLLDAVRQALDTETPIRIVGGDSKAALGNRTAEIAADSSQSVQLSTRTHEGIITYDPTELVVTVRAGTVLAELTAALSDQGQMLPFEPPEWQGATIGGVLACGLSGPRRPFSGSARDYVLGTRIINGQAQDLRFGGEVMKNVAGYDVSRLQIGAWGTLGVLLDVSMKVLPLPELEMTLCQQARQGDMHSFSKLLRKPLPLSGAMLIDEDRYIRLSGSEAAVRAAAAELGGDVREDNSIWHAVRDHTHPFFYHAYEACKQERKMLWRISVADYAPALDLSGNWLHEWGGAQRWLLSSMSPDEVFRTVEASNGHAMRYSAAPDPAPGAASDTQDNDEAAFQPLSGGMQKLQSRVRDSFDPLRLFNRGRFHPELDIAPALIANSA